jgi:hypothetical protein
MFRKTITRLAYSPALAEELTIYARKLRREEAKRQIGLIFIVLALIIQSFAVLFPPESANAGNTTDFIEGGFGTVDDYLGYYDQNTRDIKDLLTSLGISRDDIKAARAGDLKPATGLIEWKLASRGDEDDTPYEFMKSDGTTKTAYYQPFRAGDSSMYVGFSSSAGQLALMRASGNLVTEAAVVSGNCISDAAVPVAAPVPVSLKDIERCNISLKAGLSAHNLSTGTLAASRNAGASDRIMYTLTVTNNESRPVLIPLSIGLTDIMEYAELIDKGGAQFNQDTKNLTWTATAVSPGTTLTRSFIIKLLPVIPSTATGQNDPSSYDCVLSGAFGETLRIPVACPLSKSIERITRELPPSSLQANLVSAFVISVVVAYFYARSRQLRTELRLIRHNHQGNL